MAFLTLVAMAVATVGILVAIGRTEEETVTAFGLELSTLLLVAAFGGLLGGTARALYSFLFENYAFCFRYWRGRSSPFVQRICGGGTKDPDIEDDFDPLECWYLYLVKPFLGATLGLLFAMAIEVGVDSLVAGAESGEKRLFRMAVLAGLAGLFAENVMHRLRGLFTGGAGEPPEPHPGGGGGQAGNQGNKA